MRSDQREKDGIAWYNPKETKMMGRWSPTIVNMYKEWFNHQ